MATADNRQATPQQREPTIARNTRLGLMLFAVYLVLYGTFVLLNAFAPRVLESIPLGGVLYGIALIVAALVLALLYAWLCREGPR